MPTAERTDRAGARVARPEQVPPDRARRRLSGVVPVTLVVLLAGVIAALVSPPVRHALSVSFQRQPTRYVELYFPDEGKARGCPTADGEIAVVATVRSHLAGSQALRYRVAIATAAGRAVSSSTGVVGTTNGKTSDFGARLRVPSSAYTVSVTLPGRTENLSLHCSAPAKAG
jgi:hypothetical protein